MTFSEKLKSIRKRRCAENAEKIGVSRQAITKWKPTQESRYDNMMALSSLFNISLDELLSNEKTEKSDHYL